MATVRSKIYKKILALRDIKTPFKTNHQPCAPGKNTLKRHAFRGEGQEDQAHASFKEIHLCNYSKLQMQTSLEALTHAAIKYNRPEG